MPFDPDIQAMLDERAKTMLDFTDDHPPIKMYAIYRRDLEMTPGKLAAQAGHAYLNAWDKAQIQSPELAQQYKGTKVLMNAKNVGQLSRAYRDALVAGFPCQLVIDREQVMTPHFDGSPKIAAVGIGPVYADDALQIERQPAPASAI